MTVRIILKPAGAVTILLAFFLITAVAVRRQTAGAETLPSRETVPAAAVGGNLLADSNINSTAWGMIKTAGEAHAEAVPGPNADLPDARRFIVTLASRTGSWDIQCYQPLQQPLKRGSHVRLTFWARSPQHCPLTAVIEQVNEPYNRYMAKDFILSPQWQQYVADAVQNADVPSDLAKLDLQLAQKEGTIDIAGVSLRAITPS